MFKRKSDSKKKAKASKAPKAKKSKAKAPKQKKVKPTVDIVKPETDVYTVMLVVSLIAVVTGIILLYLEVSRYGEYPWWQ